MAPSTSDMNQIESEAEATAAKHVANMLQRPDQLEKVDKYMQRELRKKASVDGVLKTAMQTQLDGVQTGLCQLEAALSEIKEINKDIQEITDSLRMVPELVENLYALKIESKEHSQCSAALENLEHILNIPKSVQDALDMINEGKLLAAHQSTGRPRVTTPNEDRYLAVTAKRNRWSIASDLSRQLSSATGMAVSRQTVYRRLGHIGLYARRPVRCVPFTTIHCHLRLTWSREHALWTPQQWSCGMISEKSRFSLQSDSCRTLIWRVPGTHYHQENTNEQHRYGGAGWLVWGGIILGFRTDFHVQSVTMTGHIYRDVIPEQHARLFRGTMGAEFLFMDDNVRPYRVNIVDECLQLEDITCMDWPAYSPDLNPIEHMWDMLGRRIAARQPPPTCLPELRRALLDEWCNIPQDQIDNLILSMPRRCKACIASLAILEHSRDDLLYEMHKLANQSPTDKNMLKHYFSDVEKLSEEISKQLWLILRRTLNSVRKEPKIIVSALRIIEREESEDSNAVDLFKRTGYMPIGRPKQWRNKAFEVLKQSVLERIEGNQFEDRTAHKMWLVTHLEMSRQIIVEDLRVVKVSSELY
ncbi:exocyst complex component 3 [Trichonephila clavipes]|nr:exocyst complex component 3 [Trichonephila clavipes]